MKDNTYANVVCRTSPISNNNDQADDKYRALIQKLMQLGSNYRLKFQEQ